jgi:hypothetical protein
MFEPSLRVSQGIAEPVKPSAAIIKARIDMTRPAIRILQSVFDRLEKGSV